ncbi:F0F1 ATP synthase subunit A, partial [Pseudomonas syringae]|nr:F0F1 ATP synthase subunit A [Pseudomonas syringae]
MAEQTASGYIRHHFPHLTFGHQPNGEWDF